MKARETPEERAVMVLADGPDRERREIQDRLLTSDPGLEVAGLRQLIIQRVLTDYSGKPPLESLPWGARAWLLGTLAIVLGKDDRAHELLARWLEPSHEPEAWVIHYLVAGLIRGASPLRKELLERAREIPPQEVSTLLGAYHGARGDEEARSHLLSALHSEGDTLECAVRALCVIHVPETEERLIELVRSRHEDPSILGSAIVALGELGPRSEYSSRASEVLLELVGAPPAWEAAS